MLFSRQLGKVVENMHQYVLETTGPYLFMNAIEYVLRETPQVEHRIVTEDYEGNCTFKVRENCTHEAVR